MLFSLLNAVSTPTATLTPAITATVSPTVMPTPTIIPAINVISSLEVADVFGSIILGLVALAVSILAIIQTNRQQRKEEEMRQREAKIAVIDKAFEIYNFFMKDVRRFEYYKPKNYSKLEKQIQRESEIRYMSIMIFDNVTCIRFEKLFDLLIKTKSLYSMSETEEFDEAYTKYKRIYQDFNFSRYNISLQKDNTTIFLMVKCIMSFVYREVNDIYDKYRLKL